MADTGGVLRQRQRESHINFRSTGPFKAWLSRFASAERVTPSQLIEHGLVALAKAKGFEAPPAR